MVRYAEAFRDLRKKKILHSCFHRLVNLLPDLCPNRKHVPRKIN
jgi:hypothetical protein